MKRTISSIVAIVILFTVVLLPKEVLYIAVFLASILAMRELNQSIKKGGYKPVEVISYLSCAYLLYLAFFILDKKAQLYIVPSQVFMFIGLLLFTLIIIFAILTVVKHKKYDIVGVGLTLFSIIYVVFLLSFIILIRGLDNGIYWIWLIFIGAWVTDIFAYFAGVTLGKTKILPVISPKKSLEGCIGGLVGCVVFTVIYGLFLINIVNIDVSLWFFVVIGIVNGIVAQLGDWFASAIKRNVGIKDFGYIMPGHGGVLDRFDSLLFVAPVVYYICFMLPL